mmetsp:Transcript_39618/g.60625  ORF Transcript_39618/g.60625 Transcript_39618/m.60625 type:complete len:572 (+) Transcript_39618:2645-4360(+)
MVLSDRQVNDLELHLVALGDAASLRKDGDVLVHLTLPHEVEVELSVILKDHLLGLALVDEELAEVEVVGLTRLQFGTAGTCEHGVVDLVALTFNVEYERSSLPLDVANQVIVVVQLVLRLEEHFNWDSRLSRNGSGHRVHAEGVAEIGAALDALLSEAEAEGNVLLVNELDSFSVLSLEEQRAELDLTSFEEYVGLVDAADDEEVLNDVLRRNLEDPVGLVLANLVGCILEDHLGLLAAEDDALLGQALEDRLVLPGFILHLFPLELVPLARRVNSHETTSILDVGTQAFKLDNLEFSVDRGHVLFALLSVAARRQFEVDHRSLGDTVYLNLKVLRGRIQVQEVSVDYSAEIRLNFDRSVLNLEVIIAARCDRALLGNDAVGTSIRHEACSSGGNLEVVVEVDQRSVLNRELVDSLSIHQSRLELHAGGSALEAGVVAHQRGLECQLALGALLLLVLGLGDGVNELSGSLFRLIDLDVFLGGSLLFLGGRLRLSRLLSISGSFGFLLSAALFGFSIGNDFLEFGRSHHADGLHSIIPVLEADGLSFIINFLLVDLHSLTKELNLVVLHGLA